MSGTESTTTSNHGRKTLIIVGSIIAAFVLLIILPVIGSYNSLASGRNTVDRAWSQVEVSYQRRADLIPNLVKVAQQASVREEAILNSALEARSKALNANVSEGDTKALNDSQAGVSSALNNLIAISESYPDLKSNENWLDLQSQIEGTENRIAVSRSDYNDVVEDYNSKVIRFPSSLFAGIFGFHQVDYFAADDGASKAPDINFD